MTSLHILLVHQPSLELQVFLRALKQGGYEICSREVTDLAALKKALADGSAWDLLFLQEPLPGCTAADVFETLKRYPFFIPVIVLSQGLSEEALVQLIKLGASDCLSSNKLRRLLPAVQRALQEGLQSDAHSAAEQHLQRWLAYSPVMLYSAGITNDFKTLSISNNVEQQLGYQAQDFINEPNFWREHVHPEDLKGLLQERLSLFEKGSVGYEYRFRLQDGTYRWLYDKMQLILDENGLPLEIIGYWQNICEYKKLQMQVFQSQKNEALGRLTSGIVHDFNNILTVIAIYTGMISRRVSQLQDSKLQSFAKEVVSATHRAAALTAQLKAFSRQQIILPTVLNPNQILVHMQAMLKRLLGQTISLRVQASADLACIKVDQSQIEQVFLNLSINARDAMPKGGHLALKTYNIHLKQRYDGPIESIPAGRYVCLEAEDSGCGISSDVLPHIVEPFFTTKEFGKGTGLGLATVYGIIKQYQGYLDVKSKTGQGSTFFIYFQPFQDTLPSVPITKAISESLRV